MSDPDSRSAACGCDIVRAIVRSSLVCADAVGVVPGEEAALISGVRATLRSFDRKPSLIRAIVFDADAASAPAVAAGMAGRGIRTSIIAGAQPSVGYNGVVAAAPCVISVCGTELVPAGAPLLQLVARSPQHAADLVPLAHRMAELTLRPVMLSVECADEFSTFSVVDVPDRSAVAGFLGRATDVIDSTTLEQLEHIGGRRPRITNWPVDILRSSVPSAEERILVRSAFGEFSSLTGRAIGPYDVDGPRKADVLIIAAGRLYEKLLSRRDQFDVGVALFHPTLLAPLPTEQLVQVIARKRAVVIAAASDDLIDCIHGQLSASIERAVANGVAAAASAAPAYPELPSIQPNERPVLMTHRVEAASPVDELREVVDTLGLVERKRAKPPARSREPASDDATVRVQYRSTHSHRSASWLAQQLAPYVKGPVSVFGHPLDRTVQVVVSDGEPGIPHQAADVLLSPGRDFHTLPDDLPLVKDEGVIFLEGDLETAGDIWNMMPEGARDAIREKKLRLFLFDPDAVVAKQISSEERLDGLFLGGLLCLYSGGDRSAVDPSVIDRIVNEISKNGQVGVEVAVSQGMGGLVELDTKDFDGTDTIFVEDDREARFRLPEAAGGQAPTDERLLKRLLKFVNTGAYADRRYEDLGLVPVLLADYLPQPSAATRDYPVIVDENGGSVASLGVVVDRLVDSLEGEGDVLAEGKRVLRKLESRIGRLAADQPGASLAQLWNGSVEQLASSRSAGSDESRFSEIVAQARRRLEAVGDVWPIGRPAAVRLAHHAATVVWKAAFEDLRREAEKLHIALSELLRADESGPESDEATDHLQASVGRGFQDDVDFRALSRLLKKAGLGEPMPAARRQRIATAALALETIPVRLAKSSFSRVQSGRTRPADRIAVAIGDVRANLYDTVEFVRAIRIARLETTGRYREERHDDYFARFGYDDLDAGERGVTPPHVLDLGNDTDLDPASVGALHELLASDLPIKMIVTIGGIGPEWEEDPATALNSARGLQLGRSTVGLNRAFVLQTSLSDGAGLRDGLALGMNYPGPALFSVFEGSTRSMPALDVYLASAVAVESRLFPTFRFDPRAHGGLAEQFDARANPDAESAMSSAIVEYAQSDGADGQLEIAFTYGDVLACDVRFGRHFAVVPVEQWHEAMTPLSDLVLMDPAQAAGRVPFIWMADRDRMLNRVMVTTNVVAAVRRTLADWKIVQEFAGTDSSHVRRQIEDERTRLEEEQRAEITQAQQRLDAELDRARGELAKEIVANIAAGLLDLRAGEALMPPPAAVSHPEATASTAGSTDDAAEEEARTEPEQEQEEEVLTLDEPYIETVRCTTCNECTQLNPRLFAYNENQQAYLKDLSAGSYRDLVLAAEKCPVRIIHPGKPRDPNEPDLDELQKRAEPFL